MAYKLNPFTGNFDQVLDKASEIKYSNTTSGLTATNTQAAVDELQTTKQKTLAVVSASTATFTATANTIVLSKYNAGSRNITLPDAFGNTNAQVVIKDVMGSAETNTIIITTNGGLVDNSTVATITSNYGVLSFVSDGTDWWII